VPAHATLVSSSTSAYVTFRDCTTAGVTVCDGISSITSSTLGGLPGDTSATATQSGASPRAVSGSAQILADGAARLDGSATSLPANSSTGAAPTRDSSNSYSLQHYTYTGMNAATLIFSGTVSYDLTVPAENATFPQNQATSSFVFAYIEVFLADAMLDAGTTDLDNFSFLGGGYALDPSYVMVGSDMFSSPGVSDAGTAMLSVAVNLNPGDSVWLYSLLQTPSLNGAEVSGRLDTAIAAPEPGTMALVGLSLAGLAVAGRRRRR
jgi:hypothetical protein